MIQLYHNKQLRLPLYLQLDSGEGDGHGLMITAGEESSFHVEDELGTFCLYTHLKHSVFIVSICPCIDVSQLEDMFNIAPEGDDFSPFESKVHALAYMLINSPRPMVSTLHRLHLEMVGQYVSTQTLVTCRNHYNKICNHFSKQFSLQGETNLAFVFFVIR